MHVSEIVYYLENYKCHEFHQGRSQKLLYSSTSYIQIKNAKTTCLLFKGSWILLSFLTFKLTWLYFEKSCKTTLFRKPTEVKMGRRTCYFLIFVFSLFQISNDSCQKSYNGLRVFLGRSNTSLIFLVYTFLKKKRRLF